tara:strand:- start:2342 stop:2512 length:171 start_codon:yes stop_codon:yes gene_type:complete
MEIELLVFSLVLETAKVSSASEASKKKRGQFYQPIMPKDLYSLIGENKDSVNKMVN